ncbi:hypothetical protein GCK32_014923 [Trichostrongylus colubriformis]|uniref:Uncharacterized protein n=1 Tax=Trichostrongylus colubriformis TaxID=6319 RepID=A0AAN8IWV3_TRICO
MNERPIILLAGIVCLVLVPSVNGVGANNEPSIRTTDSQPTSPLGDQGTSPSSPPTSPLGDQGTNPSSPATEPSTDKSTNPSSPSTTPSQDKRTNLTSRERQIGNERGNTLKPGSRKPTDVTSHHLQNKLAPSIGLSAATLLVSLSLLV